MSIDKQHLRHSFLFALQLKTTAAEAKEMIFRLWAKMLFRTVRAKSGSKGSKVEIWISRLKRARVNHKKLKIKELLEENPCRMQSERAETFGVTRKAISKRKIL